MGYLGQTEGVKVREERDSWVLSSDALEAAISRSGGTIMSVCSLQPAREFLQSSDNAGMQITIVPQGVNWAGSMDKLVSGDVVMGENRAGVKCKLTSTNAHTADLAEAEVEYLLDNEKLSVKLSIHFLQDIPCRTKIYVGHKGNPAEWDRYYLSVYNSSVLYASRTAMVARYQDALWDTTDSEQPCAYPWVVADGRDRYWMWGSLDLGKFVALAPNHSGLFVCLVQTPSSVHKNDTFTFDYFFKVFPKPQNTPTEVESWYITNCESSYPLTKGIVRLSDDVVHRTCFAGNVTGPGSTTDVSQLESFFKLTRPLHQFNLWYPGMFAWDQTYPTDTPLKQYDGSVQDLKDIKRVLDELQSNGYHAFCYFRQLYWNNVGTYDDKPPYTKWMQIAKDGYFVALGGFSKWDELVKSSNLGGSRKTLGITGDPTVGFVHVDWCNDDLRKWYIDQVKRVVDYYKPHGIGWDMSWGCDIFRGVCVNHPESGGIHHGELRVQYEIYQWLKQRYPDMRVMTNSGSNNPSSLYSDVVMFEAVGKDTDWASTWNGVQRARAYKVNLLALNYDNHIPSIMKGLSYGLGWGGGSGLQAAEGFAEFSAKTYSVPLVSESRVAGINPHDWRVSASVWADKENLMIAVFNDIPSDTKISLNLNKDILTSYAQTGGKSLKFTVIAADGKPRKDCDFRQVSSDRIEGSLRHGELLLAH
jgi:hypothetical protein